MSSRSASLSFTDQPRLPGPSPRAIVVVGLRSIELEPSQPVIYDREIGLRLLYQDPDSGAEHYLIRYPAGLKTRSHRHTAASRDAGSFQVDMGRCDIGASELKPEETVA